MHFFKEHNHSHKRSVDNYDYNGQDVLKQSLNSVDNENIEMFLNSISSRNKLDNELIKRYLAFNSIQVKDKPQPIPHKINERSVYNYNVHDRQMNEMFQNQISYNNRQLGNIYKRDVAAVASLKDGVSEQIKPKDNEKHTETSEEEESESPNGHSAIGLTLVIGFVFMLVIDQIGGKISHRHHQSNLLEGQVVRNKITFTTTLGLVVHAAGF